MYNGYLVAADKQLVLAEQMLLHELLMRGEETTYRNHSSFVWSDPPLDASGDLDLVEREQLEQILACLDFFAAIFDSVGGPEMVVTMTINGHANPSHEPRDGDPKRFTSPPQTAAILGARQPAYVDEFVTASITVERV